MLNRYLQDNIEKNIGKQKVLLLFGSRRTGKSTLIENIFNQHQSNALLLQGEDSTIQELLTNRTIANYKRIVGNKTLLIIDEAQAIPEIGKVLKLMIDNVQPLTIIATGSSSFDLQNSSGEPLVGRNINYRMYPIAQVELTNENFIETRNNLSDRLLYGSFPELWQLPSNNDKELYLKQMVESYLLKDILMYQDVIGSSVLLKLLRLLAYQVGNMVSNNELANNLGISKNTVDRYLDLLEKVYVIYPLSGYSKNLRKEITKSKKWYFYDNGIRNALIYNFQPLSLRQDVGQLWEQYFLGERMKYNASKRYFPQYFFWRTYDGQEIDLVEVNSLQEIQTFECKYKPKKIKTPVAFAKAYPNAKFEVISQENYLDFIT